MCLIFFALNQHPNYKLIVAANRDEFYARETAPAKFWGKQDFVLGGCDLEAAQPDGTCGTWMGMTKTGRVAFITNYRDPHNINPKAPSRGQLVTGFLIGDTNPELYMKGIASKAKLYNGFNLVVGNTDEMLYFSNYQNEIKKLRNGFYGLSNHLLDTPWPKVSHGKSAIEKELQKSNINSESLFSIMMNEERAPDNVLPETGIGLARESALSSMFIKTNGYGTRCSTVILVKHSGETIFQERTFDLTDFSHQTREYSFTIETGR